MFMTSKAARCVLGGVLAASMAMPALAFAEDDEGDIVLRTVFTQNGSHLGWNGFTVTGEDGTIDANAVIDGDRGMYFQIDSAADDDGNAHIDAAGVPFAVEDGKAVGIDGAFEQAPGLVDRVFYEGLEVGHKYILEGTIHVHAAQAFSVEDIEGAETDEDGIPELTAEDIDADYARDFGILLGIDDGVLSVYDPSDGKVYELSYECVSPDKAVDELTDADFARKVVETDREVTLDDSGIPTDAVRASTGFSPRAESGYEDVAFDIDATGVYGWSLVAFESLIEYVEGGAALPDGEDPDDGDVSMPVQMTEPYSVEEDGDNPWDVMVGSVIYHNETTVQVIDVAIADGITTYELEPIEIQEPECQLGAVVEVDGVEYTLVRINMLADEPTEPGEGEEGTEDGVDDVTPIMDDSYGFVYENADGNKLVESEPITPVLRNDFGHGFVDDGVNRNPGDDMAIDYSAEVVATHADIADPDQTVSFISFEAYDEQAPILSEIDENADDGGKLPQTGTAAVTLIGVLLAAGGAVAGYRAYILRKGAGAVASAVAGGNETLLGGK